MSAVAPAAAPAARAAPPTGGLPLLPVVTVTADVTGTVMAVTAMAAAEIAVAGAPETAVVVVVTLPSRPLRRRMSTTAAVVPVALLRGGPTASGRFEHPWRSLVGV